MKSVALITTEKIEEYIRTGTTVFLLPLEKYAVSYEKTFSLEKIKRLVKKYSDCLFFVIMNKTIFNHDLQELEIILNELEQIHLSGIFFYDLALLFIKQKNHLKTPFVWNQTHMVTNPVTCEFYSKNNVEYASISGELSKEELIDFSKHTNIKLFYTLVSVPVVAHSRRKLLSNFLQFQKKEKKEYLTIMEKISKQQYLVKEEKEGTSFFLKSIPNHFEMIDQLEISYVILNENFIEHSLFLKLLTLTNQYLNQQIDKKTLLDMLPDVFSSAPFLQNKTIYRVKKEDKK